MSDQREEPTSTTADVAARREPEPGGQTVLVIAGIAPETNWRAS